MDPYTVTLIIITIPLIFASFWHHRHVTLKVVRASAAEARRLDMIDDEIHDMNHESMGDRYYNFRNMFLWAYGLAMAAEWLQVRFRMTWAVKTRVISNLQLSTAGVISLQLSEEYP
jgi:hypothetical protein